MSNTDIECQELVVHFQSGHDTEMFKTTKLIQQYKFIVSAYIWQILRIMRCRKTNLLLEERFAIPHYVST